MAKNSDSFLFRQWDKKDKTYVFLVGLGTRIFCIFLTFLFFANTTDLTDMVEKVAIGIEYFLSGQNPYGKWYFLHAGQSSHFSVLYIYFSIQNPELWYLAYLPSNFFPDWWYVDLFYQYPPLTFIAYLPTALYPYSIYPIDFRPSFFIMNVCIDLYIFYRLINYNIRWPAAIFWAQPLFAMILDFNSIISLPLLFLTLGLINSENPKKNAFYLGLATLSYTYAIVVLAFFFFHYLNKEIKEFFIGLLVPISIFSIFLILNPVALISNLFLSQFGHPPYVFDNTPYGIPALHLCSIPPFVASFTKPYGPAFYLSSIGLVPGTNGFSGVWWSGFNIVPYMYIAVLAISLYFILNYFKCHRDDLYYTIGYPFIILGLLVISSAGGFAHYTTIPLLIAIFGWREKLIRENKLKVEPEKK